MTLTVEELYNELSDLMKLKPEIRTLRVFAWGVLGKYDGKFVEGDEGVIESVDYDEKVGKVYVNVGE